jgi:F-type H+-transporting ATPase subunit b
VTTSVLAAESNNFLLPNATIIVEFLIFLGVLYVFYRFVVPPLTKAMRERDEMVRKQAEERDAAMRKLEQAQERYETALAEARAEAAAIRDQARADAQRIREEMREETDREVAGIRSRGEEQLAQQREQVVRDLRAEIGGLSTQLAERILGESPAEDVRRSTVERYLAELDAVSIAGPSAGKAT